MSEPEINNQDNHDEEAADEATATVMAVAVPSNFPIPAPVECKRDVFGNWKFFRMQWGDYEIATQLNKKIISNQNGNTKINHRIYQHLDIFDAIKADEQISLDALEKHFRPAKK